MSGDISPVALFALNQNFPSIVWSGVWDDDEGGPDVAEVEMLETAEAGGQEDPAHQQEESREKLER